MLGRREFLGLLGATAIAQGRRKPNIVFIMADDLGYGDLGCYGQQYIKTPNIDRLAAEGMRFTQAYAGCTVCAPSRSVLMTGLNMGHTSVRSNPGGVPILSSDVTVAEVLKSAGYATGGFGKWGLGDIGTGGVPWKQGFDEFFGYLNQVHAHYFYPEFLYLNDKRVPLAGNENGGRKTYSHDAIAERALDFIRKHKDGPFFCYMPFTIPHLEWLVPEDSMEPYKGKVPQQAYVDKRKHYADQPHVFEAYAGMVSRMDRDVGRVMALLKELNLDNDTIVFFTSDNGSAIRIFLNDPLNSTGGLRGHKQNLYEGGIRVPMIARWPGHVPKGSVSEFAWGFWDVMPTFAEIAGVKPPAKLDGASVTRALAGKEQPGERFMYWELPRYDAKTQTFQDETPMQALRMGEWKMIRPEPNGKLELYNIVSDPYETQDQYGKYPKVQERMENYLRIARVPPRPQRQPEPDFLRKI
jgi:arylsulfatase A